MHYTAIDIDIARQYGFEVRYLNQVDGKVVLCENDLLMIDNDVEQAARTLGGTLMTDSEMQIWISEHTNKE